VPIEKSFKFEQLASKVAELHEKGASMPAIAAELKMGIHTAEAALYFAQNGTPPPRRRRNRNPRPNPAKRVTFKDIAPLVARLHDVEGVSLSEIARTRGWSRPMVGRAYTSAHPERAAEALANGTRVRSPRMLSDSQRQMIRQLWREGKSTLTQI